MGTGLSNLSLSGDNLPIRHTPAKLADGRTVKAALAQPQGQSKGSILLIHEWWGLV